MRRVVFAAGSGGRHAVLSVLRALGFAVEIEIEAFPLQNAPDVQVRRARLLRLHRGRCLAAAHTPLHMCEGLCWC